MTDFVQEQPDGVVLAMDEMSLYFQATTTRVWSFVGQTPQLRVSPARDHLHFYGALNLATGQEIAVPALQQNSTTTAAFLQHLLDTYPTRPILLLLDRAPWHRGQAVSDLLAQQPRLQTLFFPPACPQLNPQEHVWERTRDNVSHNHTFSSFVALWTTFFHFLEASLFHFNFLQRYVPLVLLYQAHPF